MLKKIFVLAAAAIVGWNIYELAWPMIDNHGIVEKGSFRGLRIGDTKAEVITKFHDRTSRLKFHTYAINKKNYYLPPWNEDLETFPPFPESNEWTALYVSFLGEYIDLTFTDDRLRMVEYHRGIETP